MVFSASIVLYNNNTDEIKNTLKNVLECKGLKKLYLIDNSTISNLERELNNLSDKIYYQFNQINLGFGTAHNQAVKLANEEGFKIHFILNPDIKIIDAGDLAIIAKKLSLTKDVGLAGPQIIYPNGELYSSIKKFPNPFTLLIRRFLRIKPLLNLVNKNYEISLEEVKTNEFLPKGYFLSGCFMSVSIPIYISVGGFDERYFMYMEDIDLCRKMEKNYRIKYISEVKIIHKHNRESYRNIRLLSIHIQSAIKYFTKWNYEKVKM